MWQANRQLSGTDSVRGIDWRPATPRAHHQARQPTLAFLADRVGSRRRALRSRLAAVPSPGDASRPSDRQGGDGPQAGGATVAVRLYWMWRKAWDYQQTLKFGSQLLAWAIAARVLRFFIAPTYDDSKGACSPPWCPSRTVPACCSKAEGSRRECPVLYLLFDSLLAPNPEEDLTPLLEESGRLARLKPRDLRR
jgi:hypothetical protein